MSSNTVLTPSRVLRGAAAAGVRGALLGADLTLLAARQPIPASVEPPSQDPAEVARVAREEAARTGYLEGFTAGQQDAVLAAHAHAAAAAESTAAALQALDSATAALHERQSIAIADVEQQIVDMALAIAEAVVQRELATSAAPGRDALLRALALAPQRVDAVVRIHPEDLASVGDLTTLTAEREITLIADAAVERGGCVLDAGHCRIDAQISPAMTRVREALTG